MKSKHPGEELEALLCGALPEAQKDAVRLHVQGCAECKGEIEWLRTERAIMAERAAHSPFVAHLWSGVERRIEPAGRPIPFEARRPARVPLAAATSLAAVAALVAMLWGPRPYFRDAPRSTPLSKRAAGTPNKDPMVALDRAESEVAHAAAVLEQRYDVERARLGPGHAARLTAELDKTRAKVVGMRSAAGGDVDERLAFLEGYAAYVQSLQGLVAEMADLEVVR